MGIKDYEMGIKDEWKAKNRLAVINPTIFFFLQFNCCNMEIKEEAIASPGQETPKKDQVWDFIPSKRGERMSHTISRSKLKSTNSMIHNFFLLSFIYF